MSTAFLCRISVCGALPFILCCVCLYLTTYYGTACPKPQRVCVCVVVNSGIAIKSIGLFKSTIYSTALVNFHSRTAHLDIIKVFFIYQLMHKRNSLKRILKFTIKHLLHVSVQSPS